MAENRGLIMHMKIARKFAQTVPLAVVALVTTAAMATQTVTPYTAAVGGSSISAATVPAGSTFTFFGRYEVLAGSTGNESGLGLKVKYDKTKFANVVVDIVSQDATPTPGTLYTKCMIAMPDQQETVPASSQIVFGWIDTSVRRTTGTPNGVVGWPATADPAAPGATDGCLNPGNIVTTSAGTTPPVSLFRIQMTTLPGFTSGTTTVNLVSEGNFSYAGTTPGFTDKSIVLTAAAAPLCNLDVDGSGGAPSSGVDGLLIRRSLNTFLSTAAIMTNITLPGSATRTDPAQIRAYVQGMGNVLDVDGNGAATPTSAVDGLLIQRALNTFLASSAVTTNIVTPATGAQIRQYLNANCGTSLTP